jgi:ferredoxin
MAHVITEGCIGVKDGECISVCPVDCIHPTAEERAFQEVDMLYIDPNACIDCGLCADECQRGAIFGEDVLPTKWTHFRRRNAEYYLKLMPRVP